MSQHRLRSLAAAPLCLALSAALATAVPAAATAADAPVVSTTDGSVLGTATATGRQFLGIPYAAPPVGSLRWQPPQPVAPWTGVRSAQAFGPHCAQPSKPPLGTGSTSEDCLYLNVYTPASPPKRPLPVMVWIHGGALTIGQSDDYDPQRLVGNGAVVVSLNYRLGALGFLAHPALADHAGGPSGDYGLMDQQAALRWVQRNAGAFGGDPGNVTVFGESAGGLSVLSQMASPGAQGLFQRAIVESGAYNPTQRSLADAEQAGETFAAKAGCLDQSAECLRALPVSTILSDQNSGGYTPNIDGRTLTESLATAFASGRFNQVPVINGSNHDEYRLFVALAEQSGVKVTPLTYVPLISIALSVDPLTAMKIAQEYPLSDYPSPPVALGAAGTDAGFACSALNMDKSLSRFVPTRAYEFNDENAPVLKLPPVSFPYGAFHGAEVQYVFNTSTEPVSGGLSASQIQLADAVQRYWTDFAANGDPGARGVPVWPQFSAGNPAMASFAPPSPATETAFEADHHCRFWNNLGVLGLNR
ncbi:carboxylesterase/lipase family protein [Amycolatopsis sp. Poz14]|uniref:carboxylesterase/lipase family protein n=1 Tax=Amycolatopsis sp. Poz14 TaxID=1447705 RepID=UPI001EE8568A|nr:carboxylesterase family protein [Amycolatopsis sp. Poz14]MCG3751961.1 carboxylesterase family protein [Amycolatopsis sp. Poz14]